MILTYVDTSEVRKLLDTLYLQLHKVEKESAVYTCIRCEHKIAAKELRQIVVSKSSGCRDGTYDNNLIYTDYYIIKCPKCNQEYTNNYDTSWPFTKL